MINNSVNITDLRIPPANRLENLKGDLKGMYSIRINDKYRIIFNWKSSHAIDVQIIDYMAKLKNIHPGEILIEKFLKPLEICAYRLSKEIEIPQSRASQIIMEKRRITADTALRLSKFFGNSAKF